MNEEFRGYLRGTQTAKIYQVQVFNMQFFGWFFQRNFFVVWTITWWYISLVYFILKPYEKIQLDGKVKRSDLGSNQ